MAILKHIASKSSDYGAALEYLIFKHDELRKTPILDQNGNRIMRDEYYLDGLNCEPYSFVAEEEECSRQSSKSSSAETDKVLAISTRTEMLGIFVPFSIRTMCSRLQLIFAARASCDRFDFER